MNDDGRSVLRDVARPREGFLELAEIMSVDGADVVEAELVPDEVRQEETLDRALELSRELPGLVALGEALDEAVARVYQLLVCGMELEAIAPVNEPADVFRD